MMALGCSSSSPLRAGSTRSGSRVIPSRSPRLQHAESPSVLFRLEFPETGRIAEHHGTSVSYQAPDMKNPPFIVAGKSAHLPEGTRWLSLSLVTHCLPFSLPVFHALLQPAGHRLGWQTSSETVFFQSLDSSLVLCLVMCLPPAD